MIKAIRLQLDVYILMNYEVRDTYIGCRIFTINFSFGLDILKSLWLMYKLQRVQLVVLYFILMDYKLNLMNFNF